MRYKDLTDNDKQRIAKSKDYSKLVIHYAVSRTSISSWKKRILSENIMNVWIKEQGKDWKEYKGGIAGSRTLVQETEAPAWIAPRHDNHVISIEAVVVPASVIMAIVDAYTSLGYNTEIAVSQWSNDHTRVLEIHATQGTKK